MSRRILYILDMTPTVHSTGNGVVVRRGLWKGRWCWGMKINNGERDALPVFRHGLSGCCAIAVAIIVIIIVIIMIWAEHLFVIIGIIGCIERCFGFPGG